MKFKSLIFCAVCACSAFASTAYAQDLPQNLPIDGQMVKLDAKKLWRMTYLPNAQLHNAEKISQNVTYPSIAPDGSKVIMFERGKPGEFNALHEWTPQAQKEIMRAENVSAYVSWDDDSTFSMRERSKPFERDTEHHKFTLEKSKPILKKIHKNDADTFVVYDADDVIILESKKTKTLQAISDLRADRYYGPVLSPDQKYVAFNGLTSGIHLFDIEANAVVFIASQGTSPTFSPDGKYLIYAVTTDNGHEFESGDLVLIDLEKRAYRYISNPNNEIRIRATLSKNAEFIAYQTDDNKIFRAELPINSK